MLTLFFVDNLPTKVGQIYDFVASLAWSKHFMLKMLTRFLPTNSFNRGRYLVAQFSHVPMPSLTQLQDGAKSLSIPKTRVPKYVFEQLKHAAQLQQHEYDRQLQQSKSESALLQATFDGCRAQVRFIVECANVPRHDCSVYFCSLKIYR